MPRDLRRDRVLVGLDRALQFRQSRVKFTLIEQSLPGGKILIGFLSAIAARGKSRHQHYREEPATH